MHDLDGGYASVFNRRHKREGALFQGRFKSVLVNHVAQSWVPSRYVHLNPIRAGLCRNIGQYRWCSYRFFLDGSKAPHWLDWRTILSEFGGTEAAARVSYKRFVESGVGESLPNPFPPWDDGTRLEVSELAERSGNQTSAPYTIHRDHSASRSAWQISKSEHAPATLDALIQAVCVEFGTTVDELLRRGRHHHDARDAAVLLARDCLGIRPDAIAKAFGIRTRSSISEILGRTRSRAEVVAEFHDGLKAILARLET